MDINKAYQVLDEVLGQLPLNRANRNMLEQSLRLLHSEAAENQERKKEETK